MSPFFHIFPLFLSVTLKIVTSKCNLFSQKHPASGFFFLLLSTSQMLETLAFLTPFSEKWLFLHTSQKNYNKNIYMFFGW